MKPSEKQVQAAKKVLKEAGYLEPIWHKVDIKQRIQDNFGTQIKINKSLIDKIAAEIEDNHDANTGINWDVIDVAINNIID